MATVSTLLTDIGNQTNDPNSEVFTSALKLTALNNAQNELVLKIMGFSGEFEGIYDLLSDIVEKEIKSVGTSGFNLANLSNRNILRNGFINSRITIAGEFKFPVRYTLDKLGLSENTYLSGSDDYPVSRIENNIYYLDIDVGSYPINVTMWYIGEPFEMAASASGSGKTQKVATSDLNVLMHDLLAKIAERDLRTGRGDPTDFNEAAFIDKQVNEQILALVQGQKMTPKSGTIGQWQRKEQSESVILNQ